MKKNIMILCGMLIAICTKGQEIKKDCIKTFETSYSAEAKGDFDNSINLLLAQSNCDDCVYETNLRLGWLYYKKGDYGKSEKHYKLACIAKPKSIEALLGYVFPLAAVQNWPTVFDTYSKILSLDPNNSVVNYRIGLMFYHRKDFVACESHLKRVLDSYPFDFDALLLMAQTKVAMGKLAEAKVFYSHAVLYSPNNSEVAKAFERLQ